jgi:glutamine synthetase
MAELRNARYLSVHDLRRRINEGDVDTVLVTFTDMQGRLQGERVHATYFAEHVLDQGLAVPGYLLAVDLDMNIADRHRRPTAGQIDQEMTLVLDLQTIRLLPHQPGAVLVQCDVVGPDRTPVAQSPREILAQQLKVAASRGYQVLASTELEFMTFHNSYEEARNAHYRDLSAAGPDRADYSIVAGSRIEPLLRMIRNTAYAAGIDVRTIKARRRLGQHGISFGYQDAMATADNHAVFKNIAKEIAGEHGKSITFMASYAEQQGNACHVRLALQADDGSTAFWTDGERTRLYNSFVAGLLVTLADFTLLYAPNINSYKRLRSYDRTTVIGIATDNAEPAVENRLPGADVNPYLALAAMIAGGLYGIDHDLELGAALTSRVDSADLPRIPDTLRAARQAFDSSQIARTAFGDEVVDHYTAIADAELAAFDAAVTDWEIRRDFERM